MLLPPSELLGRTSASKKWEERLVIEPFFPKSIDLNSPSGSLDFHLGNRFTFLSSRRAAQHDPLGPNRRNDIVTRELFIPMGREFSIQPGQVLLATTLEWFRFPCDLMAYVVGRSILGRRGLLIVTASAIHPGSSGTITLEMSNLGEVALRLKPGVAVGQLFFHQVLRSGAFVNRHSTFTSTIRPVLGRYTYTELEKALTKLKE